MEVTKNIREFLYCIFTKHGGLKIRMSDVAEGRVQQSGHGAGGWLEPSTAGGQQAHGSVRAPTASLHVLSAARMGEIAAGEELWEPVPHVAITEHQLATQGIAVDCEDIWMLNMDCGEYGDAEFAAMGSSGGFGGAKDRNSRMEELAKDLCHYAAAVGVALVPQEVHKALMGPAGRGPGSDGVQRCVLCSSSRTSGTQGVVLGHDRWIDCPLFLLGKVLYRKHAGLEEQFVNPTLRSAVQDFARQIASKGSGTLRGGNERHIMAAAQSFVGKPQASPQQGRFAPSTPSRGQLSNSLLNTAVAQWNAADVEGGAKNGTRGA